MRPSPSTSAMRIGIPSVSNRYCASLCCAARRLASVSLARASNSSAMRLNARASKLVRPELSRYVALALPRQGKLSPACRVVAGLLEELVVSWGHQLTEPEA